jgi:hypothetical protein
LKRLCCQRLSGDQHTVAECNTISFYNWNSLAEVFYSTLLYSTTSKEKQKPEIPAFSAMVAGAPSRHVSAAFCCIISAI